LFTTINFRWSFVGGIIEVQEWWDFEIKKYEGFHIDYGGVNSHKDVSEMKTGERVEMRFGEVEVNNEIVKSYIGDTSQGH